MTTETGRASMQQKPVNYVTCNQTDQTINQMTKDSLVLEVYGEK